MRQTWLKLELVTLSGQTLTGQRDIELYTVQVSRTDFIGALQRIDSS